MRLVIFGGTGGVGRQLIPQALAMGHQVVAVARSPKALPEPERLEVIEAALDDREAIHGSIRGADAVLSCLGARQNTADQVEVFGQAMTLIVEAMQAHGVTRLISISGAGVLVPEDKVTLSRRAVRAMLWLFARHVSAAKERERAILVQSGLHWTLVRPPRIVPGPATGVYRVLADDVPSPKISRGDVGHLMLACLEDDTWVGRAPILGY